MGVGVGIFTEGPVLKIKEIKQVVCNITGVSIAAMDGESRARDLVLSRWIAIHLSREITGATYEAIGRQFGDRDHRSIMHACHRVPHKMEDPDFALAYNRCAEALKV